MNLNYTYIADLANQVDIPADGILSRTLHSDEQVTVILFGFAASQELAEHDNLFREITGQMELGHCHLRALGERYGFELEEICLPILEQRENVGRKGEILM